MAKPKTKRKARKHDVPADLGQVLSALVVLAEAAAELHVAASTCACAVSGVLDELRAIEEAKPRLLKVR